MQKTIQVVERRVWTKPEVSVARVSDAQIGNNSHNIDQLFPASNGNIS